MLVGGSDIEERTDVGMIERGDRAPLALESRKGIWRRRRRRREHLDRDFAPQSRVDATTPMPPSPSLETIS